ncbi:hypothetical protein [Hoeflea sp.]|uniref:hypothetical protein n=1 Tax=Hoeflea sp. TaxID=1940281 RepID=UPI003A93B446
MQPDALRRIIAENEIAPNARDGLDRIVGLISPILEGEPGDQIDAVFLSDLLNNKFGWNVNSDVSSVIIGRLYKNGVIERERIGEKYAFFIKNRVYSQNNDNLFEICSKFREFASNNKVIDDEFNARISEILDNDDSIIKFLIEDVDKIGRYVETDLDENLESTVIPVWRQTLIAEFFIYIRDYEHLVTFLRRISEIILIKEIVESYQQPDSVSVSSNTNVYLDTRPALALLGLSGDEAAEAARFAFSKAKDFGCKLCVLPTTISEIRRALNAMLLNQGWDRFGPTARAIRRQQVAESYVREVANDPEKYLQRYGVSRDIRTIDTFPGDHHFFSKERYDALIADATWTQNIHAIEHDVLLYTIAARRRRGRHSRHLFQNSSVIVSQNYSFVVQTTKFALEFFVHSDVDCPVAVAQNNFSTQVWLKTGFMGDSDMPLHRLYSACEQIISSHRGVFKKVQEKLRSASKQDLEEFELLSQDRRCLEILTLKTLNDTDIADKGSAKDLLDAMRQALVSEVSKSYDEKILELEHMHDQRVSELRADEEKRLSEINSKYIALRQKSDEYVERLKRLEEDSAENDRMELQNLVERVKSSNLRIGRFNNRMYDVAMSAILFLAGLPVSLFGVVALSVYSIFVVFLFIFGHFYRGPLGLVRSYIEAKYANHVYTSDYSKPELKKYSINLVSDGYLKKVVRNQ